jgi:hypothetical protein
VRTKTKPYYFDLPIHATMIRNERFKLVFYHDTGQGDVAQGQLFDMVDDPLETRNLWHDPAYAGTRREMTERLLNWLVDQEIRYLGGRGGASIPIWWRAGKHSF